MSASRRPTRTPTGAPWRGRRAQGSTRRLRMISRAPATWCSPSPRVRAVRSSSPRASGPVRGGEPAAPGRGRRGGEAAGARRCGSRCRRAATCAQARGREHRPRELELPFGGERQVREEELVWRRFSEVAMKGGYVELKSSALLRSGRWAPRPCRARARASGGRSATGTPGASGGRWAAWARARGLPRHRPRRAGARAHVGASVRPPLAALERSCRSWAWRVELLAMEQRITRDREGESEDTFGVHALPTRRTLGVALGPVAGLEVPLPAQAFLLAQGQLLLRRLPRAERPRAAPRRLRHARRRMALLENALPISRPPRRSSLASAPPGRLHLSPEGDPCRSSCTPPPFLLLSLLLTLTGCGDPVVDTNYSGEALLTVHRRAAARCPTTSRRARCTSRWCGFPSPSSRARTGRRCRTSSPS